MSCRKNQTLFIEALYDELNADKKKQFETHMDGCHKCRNAYQAFIETKDFLNKRIKAKPDEAFWTGYTSRMVGIFEKQSKKANHSRRNWISDINFSLPSRMWILGPVVAVGLVILGFWIGRTSLNPTKTGRFVEEKMTGAKSVHVEQVSIDDRTQRYLGRSKILLLGLVNFDPETDDTAMLNMDQQQRISQELIQEAAYLKKELDEPGQKQLRSLVTDLEVILLQIANLESQHDLPAVEMVQSGVASRGILLKIQLEEMQHIRDKKNQESKNKNAEISI